MACDNRQAYQYMLTVVGYLHQNYMSVDYLKARYHCFTHPATSV